MLTAREVGEVYGWHEKTVWANARRKRIPPPTVLGKWRKSDIDAHIAGLEHAELKEAAS